jgi:EAL and modified HD-GYP domain-containing signal transduction protein
VSQSPSTSNRSNVYVARQPILNTAGQVFGYELLYREIASDTGCTVETDAASARVFSDAVLAMGLDTLTAGRRAFMNVSRRVLLSDIATVLPSESVVLELLEDIDVDAEVIEACRRLHADGYVLALDDFLPGGATEALLPYASMVKVDMLATTAQERAQIVAMMPKKIRLVAEKVETAAVFEEADSAGYHLFQGYYFCRPATFKARTLSTTAAAYARLLVALNKPDATVLEIEELIKRDPSLTYRVLQCVNSAAYGIRRQLESIRQALVLLGLDQVRKWASVWTLAGLNVGGNPEVVTTAVVRARSCELIAESIVGREEAAEYFLLGLCSLLDAMLGRPMKEAVSDLPVTDTIRGALLGQPNGARRVLDAVIAYERALWETAAMLLEQVGADPDTLPAAYGDALTWARGLQQHRPAAA